MHMIVAKAKLFVPLLSRWLVAQPMPFETAKPPTDVAVELAGYRVGRRVTARVGRRVGCRAECLCFLNGLNPKALALTNMHNASISFIAVAADMCPRGRPACQ